MKIRNFQLQECTNLYIYGNISILFVGMKGCAIGSPFLLVDRRGYCNELFCS